MATTKKAAAKTAEKETTKKTAAAEKETKTAAKTTKKTAAKTTKAAEAKEEKKAPAKKAPAKKAAPKKTAPKKPVEAKVDFFVEYAGVQVAVADVINNVKATYGKDAKEIEVYLKPEESKAYFVADGEPMEMDVFFC
ncbi:MAG: hypothetical protein IJT85_00125 [Ruminococcus sp.]|nr:hypothetical protein [Ruminococcus sp.]